MKADTEVWRIGSGLRTLQPDAIKWLDVANDYAWKAVDPSLLELIRLRISTLLGNRAGLQRRSGAARVQGLTEAKIVQLTAYYKSEEFSPLEKQCLAFAEQFVINVTDISEADLAGLQKYFRAEQVREFVAALYVTECTQRLEMIGSALLGEGQDAWHGYAAATSTSNNAGHGIGGIEVALEHYQAAVVRGTALDAVVTEMVRLRCARTHDCQICQTLRLSDAREAGVDDAMTAKVDFYEKSDLDERIKIALRITDAFITLPDTLGEGVIHQARANFTAQALAELCLDITKWSTQKIYVALGSDGADALPKNEQGVSFFSFDQDGRVAGFTATP